MLYCKKLIEYAGFLLTKSNLALSEYQIGLLILCSEKSEVVAKYSVLTDSKKLFAFKYLHYLPTEEELRSELERERAALHQLSDIV